MFEKREGLKERKTEQLQLEEIKNLMKKKEVDKQNFVENVKIDMEDLDDIEFSRTNVITKQLINYLFWLIYRHHAPKKTSNFLMVAIMLLMILEIVGSYHEGIPRAAFLLCFQFRDGLLQRSRPQGLLSA